MINTYGPIIAWILFAISIASLVLFAFGAASKRADEASDDLADRILHGDIRGSDALNSFHEERF